MKKEIKASQWERQDPLKAEGVWLCRSLKQYWTKLQREFKAKLELRRIFYFYKTETSTDLPSSITCAQTLSMTSVYQPERLLGVGDAWVWECSRQQKTPRRIRVQLILENAHLKNVCFGIRLLIRFCLSIIALKVKTMAALSHLILQRPLHRVETLAGCLQEACDIVCLMSAKAIRGLLAAFANSFQWKVANACWKSH